MFKTIQTKLVFLYFSLVLIIMIIIGSFLTAQIKVFYYNDYFNSVDRVVKRLNIIDKKLENSKDLINDVKYHIQNVVVDGIHENYCILTDTGRVIDSSDKNNKSVISTEAIREAQSKGISSQYGNGALLEKYIEYAVLIKTRDGKNYILYVKSDNSKVETMLKEIRKFIVYGTISALILAIAIGFLLAKTITNPIQDLTVKAKEIASGKFDRRIKAKSKDEIGMLTSTFNYMAGQLKKNIDDMATEKTKVEIILKNLADGVIAFDIDGEIIHINQVALKMLSLGEEQISNMDFKKLCERMDINVEFDDVFGLSKEEKIVRIWNNNNVIAKICISSFKDDFGNIFGAAAVIQDITEQYKLDNMRKEFVANVSHELRTPITTVKSYSETLLDGAIEDKETAIDFLNIINAETDRMTRLINDLLELSKYDYKYAKLTLQEFDIKLMANESILKLEKLSKDKEQSMIIDVPKGKVMINGDRDRLQQVIINILSNAIKYTKPHGRILFKLVQRKDKVILSIKDNGIGMGKDSIDRIFERFYRVDKARSRSMGGTGLGLSIAKEIVDAHGGNIKVMSEIDKGTEMIIELPKKSNIIQ